MQADWHAARLSQPASYRRDIDGLRAIAIVPVMLFHAGVDTFSGGFVGVDVFFVVSGFLITGLIAPEIAAGRFSYVSFWERRARRLLPAMFTVVAVTAFVAYWMLLPSELEALGQTIVSLALFSSNFYFWLHTGYFESSTQSMPLLHTWSLAVEEQFYLLFPAILMAVYRSQRLKPVAVVVAIGVASLALSQWLLWNGHTGAAYYLLPSRAWELMLGAALALSQPSRRTAYSPIVNDALLVAGLCLIAIPVFVYDRFTPFPGIAAVVPCAGTALMIWFGAQSNRVRRLLDNRPMVMLGQMSYSLYLWHWPIIVFALMSRNHWLSPNISLVQTFALLAGVFVCSWITFVAIENPIRRRTLLSSRRQIFAAMGLCAASLAALAIVAIVARGLPFRVPEAALQIAQSAVGPTEDWRRCEKEPRDIHPATLCRLGPPNNRTAPRVLLWGDSHAMALFPAVDTAAKELGIVGLHAYKPGCPPVPGIDIVYPWRIDCSVFNRHVSDLIDSQRFDAVILAAAWSAYLHLTPDGVKVPDEYAGGTSGEFFTSQLRSVIDELSSKGIVVYVADEVPYTRNFRPEQFARAVWWKRGTDEARVSVADHEARLQPLWRALAGSRYERISLVEYLCPDGSTCPAIMDGRSNYFDDEHLTVHAATGLAPAFVAALTSARGSSLPRARG